MNVVDQECLNQIREKRILENAYQCITCKKGNFKR